MPTRAERHRLFQELAIEIIEEFDGASIDIPRDGHNDYVVTPRKRLETLLEKADAYDAMTTSDEAKAAQRERLLADLKAANAAAEKARKT